MNNEELQEMQAQINSEKDTKENKRIDSLSLDELMMELAAQGLLC